MADAGYEGPKCALLFATGLAGEIVPEATSMKQALKKRQDLFTHAVLLMTASQPRPVLEIVFQQALAYNSFEGTLETFKLASFGGGFPY